MAKIMKGQRQDPVIWEDVERAESRLAGRVGPSPLFSIEFLNMLAGRKVWLKAESLLPTGAFKLRGAYNKIAALTEQFGRADIITASSGNHALGVSFASKTLGQRAVVYVPTVTPDAKKENCRKLGATVVEVGDVYDEAYAAAGAACEAGDSYYVHPVADTDVVAGQGTISVEITAQLPDVQQLVVPLGGGGLVSGIAFAAKAINSRIRVVAVQAEGSPLFKRCIDAGALVDLETVDTIADGMACKRAEPFLYEMVKRYVDDVVVVPERMIRYAMRAAAQYAKLVLEGAGASALGAVLNGQIKQDLNTVVIASGGNVDMSRFLAVLQEDFS